MHHQVPERVHLRSRLESVFVRRHGLRCCHHVLAEARQLRFHRCAHRIGHRRRGVLRSHCGHCNQHHQDQESCTFHRCPPSLQNTGSIFSHLGRKQAAERCHRGVGLHFFTNSTQ